MSDENNLYENKEGSQYTQAPSNEPEYQQVPNDNSYSGPVYTAETVDYGSGKGQSKGLGIASMVLGIVSIVITCCGLWYVSLICGVVAVVLGIVQIVKNESKGMAIAGIVCGALGIIFGILLVVFAVALASSDFYQEFYNQFYNELRNY